MDNSKNNNLSIPSIPSSNMDNEDCASKNEQHINKDLFIHNEQKNKNRNVLLLNENNKLEEENHRLLLENSNISSDIVKVQATYKRLKNYVDDIHDKIKISESELDFIDNDLINKQIARDGLQNEIQDFNELLSEKSRFLKDKEEKLDQIDEIISKKSNDLKDQKGEFNLINEELQAIEDIRIDKLNHINTLDDESQKKTVELNKITEHVEESSQEKEKLSHKISIIGQTKNDLTEEIKRLTHQKVMIETKYNDIDKKHSKKTSELQEQDSQIDSLEKEIDRLMTTKKEIIRNTDKIKDEETDLESKTRKLKRDIKDKEDAIIDFKKQIDVLHSEHTNIQDFFKSYTVDYHKKHKIILSLKDEIDQLDNDVKIKEDEMQKAEDVTRQSIKSRDEMLKELQNISKDFFSQQKSIAKKVKYNEQTLHNIQIKVDKKTYELQTITREFIKHQKALGQINERYDISEKRFEKIRINAKELENAGKSLRSQSLITKDDIEKDKEILQGLKKQRKEFLENINHDEQIIECLNNQKKYLSLEVDKKIKKTESVSKKFDKDNQMFLEKIKRSEEKYFSLICKIDEKKREVADLAAVCLKTKKQSLVIIKQQIENEKELEQLKNIKESSVEEIRGIAHHLTSKKEHLKCVNRDIEQQAIWFNEKIKFYKNEYAEFENLFSINTQKQLLSKNKIKKEIASLGNYKKNLEYEIAPLKIKTAMLKEKIDKNNVKIKLDLRKIAQNKLKSLIYFRKLSTVKDQIRLSKIELVELVEKVKIDKNKLLAEKNDYIHQKEKLFFEMDEVDNIFKEKTLSLQKLKDEIHVNENKNNEMVGSLLKYDYRRQSLVGEIERFKIEKWKIEANNENLIRQKTKLHQETNSYREYIDNQNEHVKKLESDIEKLRSHVNSQRLTYDNVSLDLVTLINKERIQERIIQDMNEQIVDMEKIAKDKQSTIFSSEIKEKEKMNKVIHEYNHYMTEKENLLETLVDIHEDIRKLNQDLIDIEKRRKKANEIDKSSKIIAQKAVKRRNILLSEIHDLELKKKLSANAESKTISLAKTDRTKGVKKAA